MWQRFTERARRIIFFAQEEAGRLGENYVSTEHILLGLTRDSDSAAARVLAMLNININRVKAEIERQISKGAGLKGQDMQLTPRAKRVIDLAYDEARVLNNEYIGSEHLLLGLIREEEGMAARILMKMGAEIEAARAAVRSVQAGGKASKPMTGSTPEPQIEVPKKNPPLPKPEELRPLRTQGVGVSCFGNGQMKGRDLLSIADLSKEELDLIFQTATTLKSRALSPIEQLRLLEGKTLAMIFEKPSLRTRVTFETGMTQLGGHAIYLQPSDIKMGEREPVKDIARNLDRWVDAIMARVFKHQSVIDLANYGSVPVINALSDLEHPCQALADFQTIIEHKGRANDLKLAFIGDGNNVAHSLMLLSAKMGTHMFLACPEGYDPDPQITELSRNIAKETGAQIEIVRKPEVAAADADVLYTDVWTSMGQEEEKAKRLADFQGFQINMELLKKAKEDAIVLHCLPARRGEEITDEVMECPQSAVFDQAENRLHVQKAVLVLVV